MEQVEKYLVDIPAAWDGLPDDGAPQPDKTPATYTGGLIQVLLNNLYTHLAFVLLCQKQHYVTAEMWPVKHFTCL